MATNIKAWEKHVEDLKARIRELEAELSKARDCAAHNLDRCGEQRKENAALQESALAKANDIISGKNAQLREALGAAKRELNKMKRDKNPYG